MKEAIVTATFKMSNAWDKTDAAETGLEPAEGIRRFLEQEGFSKKLADVVPWFGLELLECSVDKIYEQGCSSCNEGWVCEAHPWLGWPHEGEYCMDCPESPEGHDCPGPGMPCIVCSETRPKGTTEVKT